MSKVQVTLTWEEVQTALKNYAAQRLSGSKLTAEGVIIKSETRDGQYVAEVSFKESAYTNFYDR